MVLYKACDLYACVCLYAYADLHAYVCLYACMLVYACILMYLYVLQAYFDEVKSVVVNKQQLSKFILSIVEDLRGHEMQHTKHAKHAGHWQNPCLVSITFTC